MICRGGEGAPWETKPFEHVIETRTLTASDDRPLTRLRQRSGGPLNAPALGQKIQESVPAFDPKEDMS